jgi:hypothetical protein
LHARIDMGLRPVIGSGQPRRRTRRETSRVQCTLDARFLGGRKKRLILLSASNASNVSNHFGPTPFYIVRDCLSPKGYRHPSPAFS